MSRTKIFLQLITLVSVLVGSGVFACTLSENSIENYSLSSMNRVIIDNVDSLEVSKISADHSHHSASKTSDKLSNQSKHHTDNDCKCCNACQDGSCVGCSGHCTSTMLDLQVDFQQEKSVYAQPKFDSLFYYSPPIYLLLQPPKHPSKA